MKTAHQHVPYVLTLQSVSALLPFGMISIALTYFEACQQHQTPTAGHTDSLDEELCACYGDGSCFGLIGTQ
jgi:hypothetical protein